MSDEVLDDASLWEDFLVGRFLSAASHGAKIHVSEKNLAFREQDGESICF